MTWAIWESDNGTYYRGAVRDWTADLDEASQFVSKGLAEAVAAVYHGACVVEVDECAACGHVREIDDIRERVTARATMSSPEEREPVCRICDERRAAARDRAIEQRIDEARGA